MAGGATSEDSPRTAAGDQPAEAGAAAPGRARGRDHLLPAPVTVSWNERQRRPVSFVWRRRRYRVERVLETWILETGWWKDDGHVSRAYWRVRAEGRVFDLRYDRIGKVWVLEQALN